MADSKDTKVEAAKGNSSKSTSVTPAPAAEVATPTPAPAVAKDADTTAAPSTTDRLKSVSHRVKQSASKDGKVNPVVIGVIAAVAVIIIALILFFTVFNGNFAKGDIRSVDFYQSKSTKDVQEGTAKPMSSFKHGEPILVKISYGISDNAFTKKDADSTIELPEGGEMTVIPEANESAPTTSVTFTYEIYKDKNTESPVRRGSLPVTVTPDTKDGDRYISVVSSARTALEAGNYTLEIRNTAEDGSRGEIIAKKTLKVTE
ncbi:MAG: hypothetical protein LBC50_02415 [Candidatus Ancillula sp.]|jgi:hypothetical protein|nr:hypothetical protein [Candidatus Ancillula sp.]